MFNRTLECQRLVVQMVYHSHFVTNLEVKRDHLPDPDLIPFPFQSPSRLRSPFLSSSPFTTRSLLSTTVGLASSTGFEFTKVFAYTLAKVVAAFRATTIVKG
jgi:hypothetical protein